MLSSLISAVLLNSIGIPHPTFSPYFPTKPHECKLSDGYNCLTSYYCGWCENETHSFNDDDDYFHNSSHPHNSSGTCIDIGYCGIGIIYGESCGYVAIPSGCFIIKVAMLSFVIIVSINLVYCVIKGVHAPLLKSNFSDTCKKISIILLYCLIFAPLMIFYFINFTVFIYILCCSAVMGIIFWFSYGGSAVIRIVNNRNNDREFESETARLLINNEN